MAGAATASGLRGELSVQEPPPAAAQDASRSSLQRARELLKLFFDHKYAEFCAAGDDTMKQRFTPEQAAALHNQISFQLGAYQSELSAKVSENKGQYVCSFELRFARGLLHLRLVVNAEGRMSGLWIDKIDVNVPYRVPDYVDVSLVREAPIQVSADPRFPLKGILTIPVKQGDGPFPGAVLVHGSGPQDEDQTIGPNKPFKDLAMGLSSRGVVVLRYVKRTKAHPTAFKSDEWTPERETIDDAVAALAAIRRVKEVDPARVFLIGHSMGGMAGPLIAQKDGKLAGLVLMAANAQPMLTVLEAQMRYMALLDDEINAMESEQIEQATKAIASVRAGRPEGVLLGVPAAYWARWDAIDAVAEARKLSIPMLILQGERDFQVTMADFNMWQSAFAGNSSVTFKSFPRLNHMFMGGGAREKPSPEEYVFEKHVGRDVIYELAAWIAKQHRRMSPSSAPATSGEDDGDRVDGPQDRQSP